MKKININGNDYTKKEAEELMSLLDQFLDGNKTPEAEKLRNTLKENIDSIFGGE